MAQCPNGDWRKSLGCGSVYRKVRCMGLGGQRMEKNEQAHALCRFSARQMS